MLLVKFKKITALIHYLMEFTSGTFWIFGLDVDIFNEGKKMTFCANVTKLCSWLRLRIVVQ